MDSKARSSSGSGEESKKGRESMMSLNEPIEDILAGMNQNVDQFLEEEEGDLDAPPAYNERFDRLSIDQEGFQTQANVSRNGRVQISINEKTGRFSSIFAPALRRQYEDAIKESSQAPPPSYVPPSLGGSSTQQSPLPLNVVIQVVGSRGDVQPFVALGKTLKSVYGHRVRLATHPNFKSFVEENGLEFFSIGGDPTELMAYMVKNPGLMPGMEAFKSGDITKRRKVMREIIEGCWRSCFESGDGHSAPSTSDASSSSQNHDHFVADALIANPPSFAHVHIAEKMGIPLHMMFTMPWTPTQAFPHPLADIQSSNADENFTNFASYALVEMMTWQGLGDIINGFREKSLGLEPISMMGGPGVIHRLKIPFTYCWSPALIPKPQDWAQNISISGFYFLSLASSYRPGVELAGFLASGPAPIYIGFGSIVVDDPNAMTKLIFEAVKKSGVRALVSKGWGGLGSDELDIPDGVFMLGNVPHDWLFEHVSCVIHHGGAGTTSAGIAAGKPTVVVPFFGDQPFWGAMIARAGAGPEPIPNAQLTADKLSEAIAFALKPETLEKAQMLGRSVRREQGCEVGAQSFYDNLPLDDLRCALLPNRVAVWRIRRTKIRLSSLAATVLVNEGLIKFSDLKLYRSREYDMTAGPWDPITGGASALVGTLTNMSMSLADVPIEVYRAMKMKKPTVADNGEGSSSPGYLSKNASKTSLTESTLSEHSATDTTSQTSRTVSSNPDKGKGVSIDSAVAAGKGFGRVVGTGLKSPMDFTLGIARGFHNAPRLYGDQTVRPLEKVDSFQSGLKAAGKGFGLGMYDGITGLVTQPLKGAKKDGAAGLVKGFGKGVGGLVLKPGAAIWSLPGYTFMGINKEVQKMMGFRVEEYIHSRRVTEGYSQWKAASPQERADIVQRWNQQKGDFQKITTSRKGFFESKKRSRTFPEADVELQDDEYENAIQASVAATSTGNSAEDQAIERAIRASMAEMQRPSESSFNSDQDRIDRAIHASISASVAESNNLDENAHTALEHALRESLALGESDDVDEDMKRAIEESRAAHEANRQRDLDAQKEEEIVMAYVMRQSLAEEEHRRAMQR